MSRLKGKFNVVDVLVALVVLALIVLGAYKLFFVNRGVAEQNGEIEYQILVEKVRIPTAEAFVEGQVVRDVQSNTVLGKIVKREISPAKEAVPTADGRLVLAEVPEKYNVLLTLSSRAVVSENNVMVGSVEVKIGAQVKIKTNLASSTGVIYGLKVIRKG
ncbi:MAG: DUF4330 domain-containing protein [Desulfotomaculales bacterium]